MEPGLQAGLFLLFLALPTLDSTLGLDPTARPANQASLEAPDAPQSLAEIEAWRDGFEAFINDSFGWRGWAVRNFNRLNYRLFRVSEQRRAVVGKNEWLYFGGPAAEYHLANDLFSDEELRQRARRIERRHRWLAEGGIAYFFTVAPNKHSIYPENLPAKHRRAGNVSRYEQLAAYLEAETDVAVIDLHQPLLAAKENELVYERTGTHWNSRGAYVAYRTIHQEMSRVLPQTGPAVPWERIEHVEQGPGELVNMLGLDGLIDERRSVVTGGVQYPRLGFKQRSRVETRQGDTRLPRAVVFHDSFAIALAPYLAEHFGEAVFQWRSNFDGELVREILPDVVIEQRVERNLLLPPFRNILPPWDEASS